jgi:hypothetical protein
MARERHRMMTAARQRAHDRASEISGTASYENSHLINTSTDRRSTIVRSPDHPIADHPMLYALP